MLQWLGIEQLTIMQTIYLISFLVGLLLLLLDILLGSLSGVLNLDLDVDVDIDGVGDSWLPLRPMCILTATTIFGGVGTLLSVVFKLGWPEAAVILLAAAVGAVTAWLVDRLVLRPLKNNRADAVKANQLIGQTAEVTVRVRPGAIGEVSIKNQRGILNYRAKWYDEGEQQVAEAGTLVGIMDISADKDTVYVVPLDMEKWVKRIKG